MRKLETLLILIVLIGEFTFGQQVVLSGHITSNGDPIAFATVRLSNDSLNFEYETFSDFNGFYELKMISGIYYTRCPSFSVCGYNDLQSFC